MWYKLLKNLYEQYIFIYIFSLANVLYDIIEGEEFMTYTVVHYQGGDQDVKKAVQLLFILFE